MMVLPEVSYLLNTGINHQQKLVIDALEEGY